MLQSVDITMDSGGRCRALTAWLCGCFMSDFVFSRLLTGGAMLWITLCRIGGEGGARDVNL